MGPKFSPKLQNCQISMLVNFQPNVMSRYQDINFSLLKVSKSILRHLEAIFGLESGCNW